MKLKFFFNLATKTFLLFILIGFSKSVFSQSPPMIPDTSKMTYNQISQGCKLYVFPGKGQTQQQQKVDEYECYKWAVEQSGVDPLNLPKKEAPKGTPTYGIANQRTTVVPRPVKSGVQRSNQKKSADEAAKAEQATKDSFIKAFSVCIEGKGYTVK